MNIKNNIYIALKADMRILMSKLQVLYLLHTVIKLYAFKYDIDTRTSI